jgi:CRISPR/Cas system CSM-associated protein Csm3 (group 7 of RAMP superfamily)
MRCRAELKVRLHAITALRIGTGTTRVEERADTSRADGEAEKKKTVEVATLIRDHRGDPFIPGSTLKGALRAIASDADLFGSPFDASAKDVCGSLVIGPGRWASGQTGIRSRTAIDPGTRGAAANKLFVQEWVEPGAQFVATIWAETEDRASTERHLHRLADILGAFAVEGGRPLAAGKTNGQGRMRLELAVPAILRTLGPDGWGPEDQVDLQIRAAPDPEPIDSLRLVCFGPYASRDGVRDGPPIMRDGKTETSKITTTAQQPNGMPRIEASQVRGVLRHRATWLHRIEHGPRSNGDYDGSGEPAEVLGLFGSQDRAAKLDFRVDDAATPQKHTVQAYPFVPLDETSAAPMDGGLHWVDAHREVSFTLSVGRRCALTDEEGALLGSLLTDIRTNGIKLGMKTSAGWGWFRDGEDAPPQAPPPIAPGGADSTVETPAPPAERITLPYRLTTPNDAIGPPPPAVAALHDAGRLHDVPLAGGVSGRITVAWHFETPILVGTSKNDGPIVPAVLGPHYILPGATLRGTIRAAVNHLAHARLARTMPAAYLRMVEGGQDADLHRRRSDASVDFAEALFGYVHEQKDGDRQLASRVSVGIAYRAEHRRRTETSTLEVIMNAPVLNKGFPYEGGGRKRYPVDRSTCQDVLERLKASNPGQKRSDRSKTVTYLVPTEAKPLIFVGHIDLHNLSRAELWMLLHAITLGHADRRHAIGQGKPFGAGRCAARLMSIALADARGEEEAEIPLTLEEWNAFDGSGAGAAEIAAKAAEMRGAAFASPTAEDFYASTDPTYGERITRRGGPRLGYQAKLADLGGLRPPIPENTPAAKARARAELAEIRRRNGGRIAAMIARGKP